MKVASRNQNGFSLMELLIVIALIGILSGMATLGFDFVRRERVSSATKEMLGDLLKARMDALTSGPTTSAGSGSRIRGAGVRFSPPSSYTLFIFDDIVDNNFDYSGSGEESNAQLQNLSQNLTFALSSYTDYSVIVYNHLGVPTRYKTDGTQLTGVTNPFPVAVVISDTSGNAKCVMVETNSIRQGAWNAGTSTCVEQ